jgi:N6-adenosine-specific RNA methylase IME4
VTWPFGDLEMFGYQVIVCDPPWRFDVWSQKGEKKSAAQHYHTMTASEIAAFPVGHLARDNCLMLLWSCGCMLPQAIETMTTWGFSFKSEIIWRKLTAAGKVRMGTGYRVRTMHEPILVGTIGNPEHKAFPSIVDGIAREHSRKPDEVYKIIRRHTPYMTRADLFSRETRYGFSGWGDQHGLYDKVETAA